jgi:uncharacterized protein (TIGR03435 family)
MNHIGPGLIALLCCGTICRAQSPPAFEVASIKPDTSNMGGPFRIGPNILSMRASLKTMVEQAWEAEFYQIDGGPEWEHTELFDVEAKAAGEASPHQIRLMLQTLLADRFQLKLHRETRTMAGYVLSADKGGPKLPPALTSVPEGSDGRIQVGGGIWAFGATMKLLARALSLQMGQPVLDQTKVEGNYDFRLRFDDVSPEIAATSTTGVPLGSVFGALREIGLKLEARKVPIEMVVIGSAERPSPN